MRSFVMVLLLCIGVPLYSADRKNDSSEILHCIASGLDQKKPFWKKPLFELIGLKQPKRGLLTVVPEPVIVDHIATYVNPCKNLSNDPLTPIERAVYESEIKRLRKEFTVKEFDQKLLDCPYRGFKNRGKFITGIVDLLALSRIKGDQKQGLNKQEFENIEVFVPAELRKKIYSLDSVNVIYPNADEYKDIAKKTMHSAIAGLFLGTLIGAGAGSPILGKQKSGCGAIVVSSLGVGCAFGFWTASSQLYAKYEKRDLAKLPIQKRFIHTIDNATRDRNRL